MRRLLAPAFLTTVSLATACTKKPIDDGNTRNPPYIEPPEAGAAKEATAETKVTKKRKRTAPANFTGESVAAQIDWSSLKTVNPKDDKGRAILAMSDDRCAVQVPFKGPTPTNVPTGWSPRSYENVDCPAEMDDPAYDDCTYHVSVDTKSMTCYCMPDGGNPPPPPRKQRCPESAKAAAKP